jgi:nucleoside 2-deoxyribosyltransferase
MIVYLSGGLSTGNNWQDIVKQNSPGYRFIDPRTYQFNESGEKLTSEEYTKKDLANIRLSDCIFAYMDKNNPSGYGLSLEVGYAKALGKKIIMVDEMNKNYMEIVRCCADYLFDNLEDGIKKLNEL